MFCFKFIYSHKFNISSKVMHSNVPSLGDEEEEASNFHVILLPWGGGGSGQPKKPPKYATATLCVLDDSIDHDRYC